MSRLQALPPIYTMAEMTDSDKQSSLLQYRSNYGHKKFYGEDPTFMSLIYAHRLKHLKVELMS